MTRSSRVGAIDSTPRWPRSSGLIQKGQPGRAGSYEIELLELEPGEEAYRQANRIILDRAGEWATSDERVAVLVVAAPGEGETVEDMRLLACDPGWPVLRIDPTADLGSGAS